MPVTVFGVATALARNPEAVAAMKEAAGRSPPTGSSGSSTRISRRDERRHIDEAVRIHTEVTGSRPLGMYQGRTSENTLTLTMEEGGFLYSADSYADELPYWVDGPRGPQLIVPYTLDANDMRFATPQGFNSGDQFFAYLKDSFDVLYAEGERAPKMMSVGLHCRLVGRPGRAAALARFLDYVRSHDKVWVATRLDIARHWMKHHPPKGGYKPSRMSPALFVEVFGDIFEHTPQIAARAHALGFTSAHDTASGSARGAGRADARHERGREARAHSRPSRSRWPAGARKAAHDDSAKEQGSAGLDKLTPAELKRFTELNDSYKARFGFPFIMAVKGASKEAIMAAFEKRIGNDADSEFDEAMTQIEKIAALRLADRLPP
jgi:OHCU decarboxylase